MDDLLQFLKDNNKNIKDEELQRIADNVRLVGADTDFATLHKVYKWMVNGVPAVDKDGRPTTVNLIDFTCLDNPLNDNKNIFRVVNQFTVDYINNGVTQNRRPDVLLYVNGIPVCVIELKNPTDAKATIYDAINEIHVLATPTQKLPVDVAARKALASLYDEIIVNAKKEGNTRRVGIYEQAKNNISQMEKETVYKQFLDYCYRKIRYSDYSMSTVDFNINDVTSIETDKIRVKNEGGWFYRLPKNGYGEITHRISINAKGDPNLIKALDDLFGNGEVKGYYKTPDTADNWTMRHDPITIYLEEKPTPEILEKVRVACEKYVRSTDDVLTGNKFAPGFAWEISPNKSIIEEMLNRAKTIDADLENVLRIYFTKTDTKGNPRLTASAAEYSAAKILLESMQ